jgi:hypothetical protein
MGLGAKIQRLGLLLEPEIGRMLDKHAARVAGHDDMHHDGGVRIVTYRRGGGMQWRASTEPIGRFSRDFGSFRWWWHGLGARASAKSKLDAIIGEGQRYGIEELTADSVSVRTDAEAELLARVAAHIAKADGLLREPDEDGVAFFALYDAPLPPGSASTRNVHHSAPPPYSIAAPPMPASPPSMAPPVRTIAPPAPAPAVDGEPPHEPDRDLFTAVAQHALSAIAVALPNGFTQALVTVALDSRDGKVRFFVQIVAMSAGGDLVSIDATRDLYEATATMITEDIKRGGGRWKKLVGRLRRTARGASIEVEMG